MKRIEDLDPVDPLAELKPGVLKLNGKKIGVAVELEMNVQKRWIISCDVGELAPKEASLYLNKIYEKLAKILPEDSFVVAATCKDFGAFSVTELEMGESQVIEQEIRRLQVEQNKSDTK